MPKKFLRVLCLLPALAGGFITAAGAQTPLPPAPAPQAAIASYPAAYFAGAQLSTAYDMVGRLPGFVFDDGNSARGFAGNAGNVLIDGARPTAKTDDLQAILKRIAATRVARIDIIRGGAPGIDMQGQSVVANVILTRGQSTTIVATLQNTFYGDGHDVPGGTLQYTLTDGARTYDATLTRFNDVWDDSAGDGFYTLLTPGAGQPTTEVSGRAVRRGAERVGWGFNGAATLPLWSGTFVANLTAQKTIYNSSVAYDAPDTAFYFDGERTQPVELGLTWSGTFGASQLTLLALQRLEQDHSYNTGNDSTGAQIFALSRNTGESILRATWRYNWSDTLTFESGGEGAYNTLKGDSTYLFNGAAVALPAADSRVGERRGEAFAQGTWKFADSGSLEAALRFEFSRISALGVAPRNLSFPKPRLLFSWSPVSGGQLRLRAERVIGQLDFSNFVASSNLSGNGVSAGNLALRPDRRWQYQVTYEQDFWGKGALVASAMQEDISDLVDYVPIGGGLDGPGNVAHARNNEYKVTLSLPFDQLGLAGGVFKSTLQWDDSALKDPVTGVMRSISNQQDRNLQLNYTQDLPAWKSSLQFTFLPDAWSRPSYRIAQISKTRLTTVYLAAIWDYKPEPDLDLNFDLENFLPYHLDVEQDNYAGPRNTAPLSSILNIRNNAEPRLFVQLRKTF